jgi:sulfur carrier protein
MPATRDTQTLDVVLNGAPFAARAATLAGLIAEAGYGELWIAAAGNGDFVPERARGGTRLEAGDHIEVVSVRQGG